MTFETLPTEYTAVQDWSWAQLEPYFTELLDRDLTPDTLVSWMQDWTRLSYVVSEMFSRARVATSQNTADEDAEARYNVLMAEVYPNTSQYGHKLNRKLVDSGLTPDNFAIPLKKMQAAIALFREENIPLAAAAEKLGRQYGKITGGMTVEWDGEERTLPQMSRIQEDLDRDTRERAFRASTNRYLQDREAINDIWTQLFGLRQEMAKNAGYDNYRDYIWQERKRFDYTPQDCVTFHAAIEEVVVPAAARVLERRKARLGVDPLRPWDLSVDPDGRSPLNVWDDIDTFIAKARSVFEQVGPRYGDYYSQMVDSGMIDLPNRKNKRPGAYCTRYSLTGTPFVFMNAVGARTDIKTLLHEFGHAFHGFESMHLPYAQQQGYPIEFAEVASMAMELLAAPYLTEEYGGYFTPEDAARDRIAHLESILLFWPYMAVVDAFQHWAYQGGDAAADPANCDAKWSELWDRFMPVTDWSGLEDAKVTGWHRKQHIYLFPFYYIEYGLARLGSVQVWDNALKDQAAAVEQYRQGLAMGGTGTLPELFGAAGATFAFDAETLGKAVALVERVIAESEQLA